MNWTAIFFPVWILRPRFLLVLVFLVVGALLIAFNYSYSDGNRAGYIQKFSRKGWVCTLMSLPGGETWWQLSCHR